MNKKVVRTVINAIYGLAIGFNFGLIITGNATLSNKIIFSILLIFLIIRLLYVFIDLFIIEMKFNYYYGELFKIIKIIHQERYRNFFTGNCESLNELEEALDEFGKSFLEISEFVLNEKKLSKKKRQKVQKMVEDVNYMFANVQPKEQ